MPPEIDLPRYLARIGWTGAAPSASLANLNALVERHVASIPFENLNPLLGLPVSLALEDIERKLVDGSRGGYCFEQNRLFAEVLGAIGFEVTTLVARVLWMKPEDMITPRSHMVLKVGTPEGDHLVDVGFGGLTLTGAIALREDIEQATPHETFRLARQGDDWRLRAFVQGEWKTLYRFDLQPQHPIDYETFNHFTATHPSSHFTINLVAARSLPGKRLALLNRQFTVHHTGGPSERRELADSREIRAVLEEKFLIRFPDDARLTQRLDALP